MEKDGVWPLSSVLVNRGLQLPVGDFDDGVVSGQAAKLIFRTPVAEKRKHERGASNWWQVENVKESGPSSVKLLQSSITEPFKK